MVKGRAFESRRVTTSNFHLGNQRSTTVRGLPPDGLRDAIGDIGIEHLLKRLARGGPNQPIGKLEVERRRRKEGMDREKEKFVPHPILVGSFRPDFSRRSKISEVHLDRDFAVFDSRYQVRRSEVEECDLVLNRPSHQDLCL